MRLCALLLSAVLGAGAISALAQDTQPTPAPDPAPAQPAGTQPKGQATDQEQPPGAGQDQPASPKIKHDGGKNDVDAIGTRKVGGLDWYSIETDIKIGKTYAQQIERSMRMVDDPVVNEYVNRIGQNLVRNSDAKFPFTIKVVDADDVNAMSLPGGILYVNSGLILAADDESELAGVMAHEIAHSALRHATRQMTRTNIFQIMTIPVIAIGVPVNPNLILPVTALKFSRDFEAEADYYGLQYMYKAGYDPNGLLAIFEKLRAWEKRKPGALARAFSTHPQTPDRVKKSQKEIATILPARDHYVETTSEFTEVKARLAVIENRSRMVEAKPDRPVLKRIAVATAERPEGQ